MKKPIFIFIGGMLVGALLLYFVLYIISIRTLSSEQAEFREQFMQGLSRELSIGEYAPEVQFVEVEGRNGNVMLHTGMSKDSVQILVGKPDKIDLHSIGDTYYEEWSYNFEKKSKPDYLYDLYIDFKNGTLDGVKQD